MSDNTDYRETCHGPGYRMIVVVEGISAAGKTTWCHKHAAEVRIPEVGPCDGAPDPVLDPRGAARFWVEKGARRWTAACEMERSRGLAVCDTDPLKLHYTRSLWQIGVASEWHWLEECAATREAIVSARLGFSDVYLMKSIDPWVARQQRDADPTRSRRNFDLHVQLHDPLVTWYRTMERLLPGAIIRNLPDKGLASLSNRGDQKLDSDLQPDDRSSPKRDVLPFQSPAPSA